MVVGEETLGNRYAIMNKGEGNHGSVKTSESRGENNVVEVHGKVEQGGGRCHGARRDESGPEPQTRPSWKP
jgi:hypothetical protein